MPHLPAIAFHDFDDNLQLNEDATKLFEAFFVTKYSIYCVQENLRSALAEPMSKDKAVDTERKKGVITCLEMVC